MRIAIALIVAATFSSTLVVGYLVTNGQKTTPRHTRPPRSSAPFSETEEPASEAVSRADSRTPDDVLLGEPMIGPPPEAETPSDGGNAGEEGRPVDLEMLRRLVREKNAPELTRAVEQLLSREDGYPLLQEFLRGELTRPESELLNDSTLLQHLFFLVEERRPEVSGFASYVLASATEDDMSLLRGHVYRVLRDLEEAY